MIEMSKTLKEWIGVDTAKKEGEYSAKVHVRVGLDGVATVVSVKYLPYGETFPNPTPAPAEGMLGDEELEERKVDQDEWDASDVSTIFKGLESCFSELPSQDMREFAEGGLASLEEQLRGEPARIQAAVEEERERCLKVSCAVVENIDDWLSLDDTGNYYKTHRNLASELRAAIAEEG